MKLCNNLVRTLFFLAANAKFAVAQGPDDGPDDNDPANTDDDAPPSIDFQDLLPEPTTLWTTQLFPNVELGSVAVEAGNGIFMAPDGKHAIVTTVGATVYAFNAYNGGDPTWVYQAPSIDSSIARSHSSVTFAPSGDYMVYAVVDNENSLDPSSRVIALDMDGNELWVSDDLDGVASGSPQVSSDGAYVFITHNADDKSNGYFTTIDANVTAGSTFYSGSSGENGDEPTNAYGPVGIFHNPTEGNYDPIESGDPVSEGDFNTNDMLMFAQTPKPSDAVISNGFLYGFQFPRDFVGNASEVDYFQMGTFERDFQTLTKPVMTNNGLSAYWGVSRSGFRGWAPKRFSRARSNTVGFTRNEDSPGQPVWACPALSNDGPEPTIFGGSAAKEFVRMSYDFTEQLVVPTSGYVKTTAIVDGDERAVYYVESETGTLHQAGFDDLTDLWSFAVNFSVDGEMAITPRSDVVLVADTRGVITALQVAEIPTTEAPSMMPSDGPSMDPTGPPAVTTSAPTALATTGAPVADTTTEAPVASPVSEPVASPVMAPVAGTEEPPTPSGAAQSTTFIVAILAGSIMMLLL